MLGPPGMYQGPPGMYQGPPGMYQGPPGMYQGPPGMHQGPPGPPAPTPVVLGPAPTPVPGVPPALLPLLNKSLVFVRQHVEIMELLTRHEMPNRYTVMDGFGQPMYRVVEQSDFMERECHGSSRSFTGYLDDYRGNCLIINRPNTVCCGQEDVTVSTGGAVLGRILQNRQFLTSTLIITDGQSKPILEIEIPIIKIGTVMCPIRMGGKGGGQIGAITKQWAGYVQEAITDADNFNITFPGDLDVRLKAVLVAACIIIDFMYFEQSPQQEDRYGRRGVGVGYGHHTF